MAQMGNAEESRREAFETVAPSLESRRWYITQCMADHSEGMTAEEITEELYKAGLIAFNDKNFVKPRLTEMKRDGVIESLGRRKARTGIRTTVWALK